MRGAAGLVATGNDPGTCLGGRVSEAFQLVELAERALVSAVIYECERGTSWKEIAQYLGIGPAEAEERFTAMLDDWNAAFEIPYRLDTWAGNRLILVNNKRPVSSGLLMAVPDEELPSVNP